MDSVVCVQNLSFAYPPAAGVSSQQSHWIIRDLSLDVQRGEIVSILGASGCGKTTLLNLIAGLIKPDSGSIVRAADAQRQGGTGYIFQHDALLPWRTIEANLLIADQLRTDKSTTKEQSRKQINQYLKSFHLDESTLQKFPSQASGGMRQRISLIQSLMFNPSLLLLDEPFSALDFFTKLALEAEFYNLIKAERRSAILVTHDIDEAIAISDRILIMKVGGELINEYAIDLGALRAPENVRAMPEFAAYYGAVWGDLKTVIAGLGERR